MVFFTTLETHNNSFIQSINTALIFEMEKARTKNDMSRTKRYRNFDIHRIWYGVTVAFGVQIHAITDDINAIFVQKPTSHSSFER